MKYMKPITTVFTGFLAVAASFGPSVSRAAEYDVLDVPLIVSIEAIPNVFLEMDDSGSMNWEIMAGPHWTMCAYDGFVHSSTDFPGSDTSGDLKTRCASSNSDDRPAGDARMLSWSYNSGSAVNNASKIRRNTAFIFNFSTNTDCNHANNVELCEDEKTRVGDADTQNMDMDWRIRSSDMNKTYYNPFVNYEPWVGGSTNYTNASWNAARSWPDPNEGDYNDTYDLGAKGFHFNIWDDDKGYSLSKPSRDNMTTGGNGEVDLWDTHTRVTVTGAGVTCERFAIQSASSSGLDAVKTTLTCDSLLHLGGMTHAQIMQNIANWFQYHRRRVHVANYALGKVLTDMDQFRYGLSFINHLDNTLPVDVPMPAASVTDFTAHITSILDTAYQDKEASGNTPLRGGLDLVGQYYMGNVPNQASPIELSCQKNFAVLFTDGYWDDDTGKDDDSDLSPIADEDADGAQVYGNKNLQSTLLADVAQYYYDTDLSGLPNAVPTDLFDTANYQHMVTFTINFGSNGLLTDPDNDGWPGNSDPTSAFDWYSGANTTNTDPAYWDPRKADDMWHAAWNSKGTYVAAGTPEELVTSFRDALLNIDARISGAAAAAANSGSISSSSKIFQAKFDSSDWHGELLAIPVNDDGTLATSPLWNSSSLLDAKSNTQMRSNAGGRDVFTWNDDSTPTGTPFEWSAITMAQKALLDMDASGNTDGLGDLRLAFVRGDKSEEQPSGGSGYFRYRNHRLGDIVNSDPTFVGIPSFFYPFDNYQTFFSANLSRTGVIYMGANDGMVHAIRESDGEELFAYVPDAVIHKLPKLTDKAYAHEFFVDGAPEYGDAQINSTWKSVLAGGLRGGGQAVYALDVTNPDSFNSNNVLWEFSDEIDADLGYTYGQPQIKQMANGKWAVIIGNGINNTEADGHASTTGTGAVYILFIEDGINGWTASDYVKITVPGGSVSDPNAVFTPAAADIDGDYMVDTIYAGDRLGKMWKIDVSSNDPTNWGLAFGGNALFDAGTGQPITTRPAIAAHPYGRTLGQLVVFGTGQFIEKDDNVAVGTPTQSIYAIWDFDPDYATAKSVNATDTYGYSLSDLSASSFAVNSGVRVMGGGTEVEWLDTDGDPNERGWYIPFPITGERMVRRPILRDDLVFFVSMIPNDDPCAAGGTGWIQVLDILTGQAPDFPVFDIDLDLDVSREGDLIEAGAANDTSDDLTPVGVSSPSIPNLPAIIYDDRPGFDGTNVQFPPLPNGPRGCDAGSARAYTFTTGSNGAIMSIETATESLSCGRQSWRSSR